MIENYINKHTVMGMMSSNYIPFDDWTGFYKNKKRDKIVVFSKDKNIKDYKEVNYYYIFDKPEIKIKNIYSSTLLISHFDSDFFKLSGKSNKEIRETRNKYNKVITIENDINSIDEVILLINKWDELSGGKYGWQKHSGYDKSFFIKYYEKEKNNLISLFFYLDNILVGYSIVSNIIENNCFKYVIRKMNVGIGRNICLYIDFKTFENLYNTYGREFYVNWGASSGNVLKYKKKFSIFREEKMWFYKIKKEEKIKNDK